jgi:hypothetical protein
MSSPVSTIFASYNGSQIEDVSCKLQSNDSIITATLRFVNGTLWWVNLYPYNSALSSAHYANQLPTEPIETTRILLQRLQEYYEDSSYIKQMLDSLQTVNSLEEVNATIEDMIRQVIVQNQFIQVNQTLNYTTTTTSITFMYTFGEASTCSKEIVFRFRDGAFEGFGNGWPFFKINNEKIVISREQAINIALEQLNNASSNEVKLRNENIRADLTLVAREPFELHPFWFIGLPLASVSSSNSNNLPYVRPITEWQVGIWADTGKIEYSHPA